jgi:hypothetical protein
MSDQDRHCAAGISMPVPAAHEMMTPKYAHQPEENTIISAASCPRTKLRQSGALENMGLRETNSRRNIWFAVNSLAPKSPQNMGILAIRLSEREALSAIEWRRERDWNPTFSSYGPVTNL